LGEPSSWSRTGRGHGTVREEGQTVGQQAIAYRRAALRPALIRTVQSSTMSPALCSQYTVVVSYSSEHRHL
jgi:hypothetical protein